MSLSTMKPPLHLNLLPDIPVDTAYVVSFQLLSSFIGRGSHIFSPYVEKRVNEFVSFHNLMSVKLKPGLDYLRLHLLPRELKEDMIDFLPGLTYMRPIEFWKHLWKKHGCKTGLTEVEFFTLAVHIARKFKNLNTAIEKLYRKLTPSAGTGTAAPITPFASSSGVSAGPSGSAAITPCVSGSVLSAAAPSTGASTSPSVGALTSPSVGALTSPSSGPSAGSVAGPFTGSVAGPSAGSVAGSSAGLSASPSAGSVAGSSASPSGSSASPSAGTSTPQSFLESLNKKLKGTPLTAPKPAPSPSTPAMWIDTTFNTIAVELDNILKVRPIIRSANNITCGRRMLDHVILCLTKEKRIIDAVDSWKTFKAHDSLSFKTDSGVLPADSIFAKVRFELPSWAK